MLGMPTVETRIGPEGRGGFIAARLWDVHRGKQLLVSRGVYRLRDNQRGPIVFQLFGNGWRFAKGHIAKLELLGRDPNFLRTSNFQVLRASHATRVSLPAGDRAAHGSARSSSSTDDRRSRGRADAPRDGARDAADPLGPGLCEQFAERGFHVIRFDNRDAGLSTKITRPSRT